MAYEEVENKRRDLRVEAVPSRYRFSRLQLQAVEDERHDRERRVLWDDSFVGISLVPASLRHLVNISPGIPGSRYLSESRGPMSAIEAFAGL